MDEPDPRTPRHEAADGVPIGRALDLPPRLFNEDLYGAVRSIDAVHRDGRLPIIPVLIRPGLRARGRFVVRDGMPSEILIRSDVSHRGFALLHKVGHLLDYAALGDFREFGSAAGVPELAAWGRACEASLGHLRLEAAVTRIVGALPPGRAAERDRLEEPLSPEEAWARSYAQYVTVRSSDSELLSGLEAARTPEPGRVYHLLQWDDDDFRTIAEAIDALFGRLGWRTATTS
jgi:hypothetical protein